MEPESKIRHSKRKKKLIVWIYNDLADTVETNPSINSLKHLNRDDKAVPIYSKGNIS